jgi:catechol 2,3-dioxygenase-like lactoylglutathione lyase family enzyme
MSRSPAPAAPAVSIADAPPAPPAIGVFEIVLEVEDLAASERFYVEAVGLPVVDRWGEDRPAIWVGLGREGYLGLWLPRSGGAKGLFGSRGGSHVHLAIRVPRGTLDQAQARLEAFGYPIAGRLTFGPGDHALYVLDPDGNVVELTERVTVWGGGPATE